MDTWTTQKGFPAVTVTRTGAASVLVSQRRFLLGAKDDTDDHEYTWWVPVTYAVAGGNFDSEAALGPKAWLEAGQESVEVLLGEVTTLDDLIIFNVQVNSMVKALADGS